MNRSDRSETNMVTENLLNYTMLTNLALSFYWKARAILRLWVLNKRRYYFWHMLGDWLKWPAKASVNWLLVLSISSAPVRSCIPIGPRPKICDVLELRHLLQTSSGVRRNSSVMAESVAKSNLSTSPRGVDGPQPVPQVPHQKKSNVAQLKHVAVLVLHMFGSRHRHGQECPGVNNKRNLIQARHWTSASDITKQIMILFYCLIWYNAIMRMYFYQFSPRRSLCSVV